MNEFQLIERFFSPLGQTDNELFVTGNGDDCTVLTLPAGASLCCSIDTMVEGVHFLKGAPADRLAYRSLAGAMSDLAAMGASPAFFTLALTLPEVNEAWLARFAAGLKKLVDAYNFPLLGGDTTKGPLCISIQVHGLLYAAPLLRSGAQAGDIIAVSGTLGDAGAALSLLEKFNMKSSGLSQEEQYLLERYYSPSPRIALGQALLSCASSCIDISDGLLAEAAHIAKASSVALSLDSDKLPVSSELLFLKGKERARELALSAGDDYELLFTLAPEKWEVLVAGVPELRLSQIGVVQAGEGVFLDGLRAQNLLKGYQHFE